MTARDLDVAGKKRTTGRARGATGMRKTTARDPDATVTTIPRTAPARAAVLKRKKTIGRGRDAAVTKSKTGPPPGDRATTMTRTNARLGGAGRPTTSRLQSDRNRAETGTRMKKKSGPGAARAGPLSRTTRTKTTTATAADVGGAGRSAKACSLA